MTDAMKRILPLAVFVLVCAGCDQMAQQPSVRTHEGPQRPPPSGAVAVNAPPPMPLLGDAAKLRSPLPRTSETVAAGKLAYRRYCWPCHGPNLDGNATVGPSFPRGQLSLLAPEIKKQSDGELYWKTLRGAGFHPALATTLTSAECWETIAYVRAVQAGERP